MPVMDLPECAFCVRMHEHVLQLREQLARAELANQDLRAELDATQQTLWDVIGDSRVSLADSVELFRDEDVHHVE